MKTPRAKWLKSCSIIHLIHQDLEVSISSGIKRAKQKLPKLPEKARTGARILETNALNNLSTFGYQLSQSASLLGARTG